MKKLTIAAAILLSTLAFTSCTKENVKPQAQHKATTLADKGNLSQADFAGDPDAPVSGDKGNLSQADGAN